MFGPLVWFGGFNVATWTFAVVLTALIALLLTALAQRAARRRTHNFGFVAGSLQARRFLYEHGHKLPPHQTAMTRAGTPPRRAPEPPPAESAAPGSAQPGRGAAHSSPSAPHTGADVPPPPSSAPSIGTAPPHRAPGHPAPPASGPRSAPPGPGQAPSAPARPPAGPGYPPSGPAYPAYDAGAPSPAGHPGGAPVSAAPRSDLPLNILLYVGGLLIVAAIGAFMLTTESTAIRLSFAWGAALVFYAAGMVLHRTTARLRTVGIAFTGTGLAILPFAGLALGGWDVTSASVAWLLTSLAGALLYMAAAVALGSRIISWLSIGYLFSSVLAAVSFASTDVVWHLAVLILVCTAVQGLLFALPLHGGPGRLLATPARHLSDYLPLAAAAALLFVRPGAADIAIIGIATSLHLGLVRAIRGRYEAEAALRFTVPATLMAALVWLGSPAGLGSIPARGIIMALVLALCGLAVAALAAVALHRQSTSKNSPSQLDRAAEWTWMAAAFGAMLLAAWITRFDSGVELFNVPAHTIPQLIVTLGLLAVTITAALLLAHRLRSLALVVVAGAILPLLPISLWTAERVQDPTGVGAPATFFALTLLPVLGYRALPGRRAPAVAGPFAALYAVIGGVWLAVAEPPHGILPPMLVLLAGFGILVAGVLVNRTAHLAWSWPVLLGLTLPVLVLRALDLTRDSWPVVFGWALLTISVAGLLADAVLLLTRRRGAGPLSVVIGAAALRFPALVWLILTAAAVVLTDEGRGIAVALLIGSMVLDAARTNGLLLLLDAGPQRPAGTPATGQASAARPAPQAADPARARRFAGLPRLLLTILTVLPLVQALLAQGPSALHPAGILIPAVALAACIAALLLHRIRWQYYTLVPAILLTAIPIGTALADHGAVQMVIALWLSWAAFYALSWGNRLVEQRRTTADTGPSAAVQQPFPSSAPPSAGQSSPPSTSPAAGQLQSSPPAPPGAAHPPFAAPPQTREVPSPARRSPAPRAPRLPGALRSPRTLTMYLAAAGALFLAAMFSLGLPSDDEVFRSLPRFVAGLTFMAIAVMVGMEGLPRPGRPARQLLLEPAAYPLALGLLLALSGLVRVDFYIAMHLLLLPAFAAALLLGWARSRRTRVPEQQPPASVRGLSGSPEPRWIVAMAILTFTGLISTLPDPEAGWKSLLFLCDHVALLVAGALTRRPLALWWGLVAATLAVVFGLRHMLWLALLVLGLIVIAVVVWQLLRRKPDAGKNDDAATAPPPQPHSPAPAANHAAYPQHPSAPQAPPGAAEYAQPWPGAQQGPASQQARPYPSAQPPQGPLYGSRQGPPPPARQHFPAPGAGQRFPAPPPQPMQPDQRPPSARPGQQDGPPVAPAPPTGQHRPEWHPPQPGQRTSPAPSPQQPLQSPQSPPQGTERTPDTRQDLPHTGAPHAPDERPEGGPPESRR
ncbi:hypothetical protein [Sediminivirga luteola]|uniref:Uncharacterized protein n=1 Tax=Sediminivirga luteola TaxID=1774748 RepID=A0A8J2TWT4_9MICO|nr:hypothetical protein [Sediminivirga luteola]GGA09666.1 hypothetical protein GCM10011333_10510 [Sediminivirga luteola]